MIVALSDVGQEPRPLVWSNERYLALVESGVIEDGRAVELIDGQVLTTMPQGKLHNLLFLALQRAFAAMGLFQRGLAVQTTVVLQEGNTYDPEFALLRPDYDLSELPVGADVIWAIEVSVSSRYVDLNSKKAGYASAGVPTYWVVDALQRGVWVFTNPVDGEYRQGTFVPAGETLRVPIVDQNLDTTAIFPPA